MQAKYAKNTWLYYCVGVKGRVKFAGTNKRSSDIKYYKMLIASAVAKGLSTKKKSKAKATDNYYSDDE